MRIDAAQFWRSFGSKIKIKPANCFLMYSLQTLRATYHCNPATIGIENSLQFKTDQPMYDSSMIGIYEWNEAVWADCFFFLVCDLFIFPSSIWHLYCLVSINLRKNTILWLSVVILTIRWFCKQFKYIQFQMLTKRKWIYSYKKY